MESLYIRKPSKALVKALKKIGVKFIKTVSKSKEPAIYLYYQLNKCSLEPRNYILHDTRCVYIWDENEFYRIIKNNIKIK